MLKSTADLIVDTHEFFYEIGYLPKKGMIKHDRVNEQVELTLRHAKELGDALCILRLYLDYLSNEKKIIKVCAKYPDFWDELGWDGKKVVRKVNDKDALGSYYLTNVFDLDKDTVTMSSQSFKNTIFVSEKENGYFQFGPYFLRFSRLNGTEMVIANESKEKLAVVSYEGDGAITLKNNITRYAVFPYEGGMGIYKTSYIDSLGNKKPSLDRCKGFIEWDILDEKGVYGLSLLEVYDAKADLELMFSIAASCFLVFKKALKTMEFEAAMSTASTHALMFQAAKMRTKF